MNNKKYLPTTGFVVLLITIILATVIMKWALGPLSYEKAAKLESKAHSLVKKGEAEKASRYFLESAKIDDDKISISRRYRCAGSTTSSEVDKINYFRLALKHNPNNKNAKESLEKLSQNIRYQNRYADGWSKGKVGKIAIKQLASKSNYIIKYATSSPKENLDVKIFIDSKLYESKKISSGKHYFTNIRLLNGAHQIKIEIQDTFNPKVLGMSEDNRDLGINYEIIKGSTTLVVPRQ